MHASERHVITVSLCQLCHLYQDLEVLKVEAGKRANVEKEVNKAMSEER